MYQTKAQPISTTRRRRFYEALMQRDSDFDGVVYFGIKSTGVFCRPVCTARKPKFENCQFFQSAQEALLAGFRPCKRCRPLGLPGEPSTVVKRLVDAVEAEPEKRWTDRHFRELGVDSSTARRHFKRRFGMTFVAYARSRRMGLAMEQIRAGQSVIESQLDAGYESGSGFRDAFSRILGAPPRGFNGPVFQSDWIDTQLGPMLAVADSKALFLLEFTDRRGLERDIQRLRSRTGAAIVPGGNEIIASIKRELNQYFSGTTLSFATPFELVGTEFEKRAWRNLLQIPVGEVRSYAQQAAAIGSPTSVRAVARANGANRLAIIVPCHRIIGASGELTGYGGGLARKKWLLDHERSCVIA
jgi:AraC family transcriptional regulator of adaptative response/methylated-DNA-[protein]-cysteine methyltransferase